MNNDKCIVSFAKQGRENYNKGLLRLRDSIKDNCDYDSFLYSYDQPNDGIIFLDNKMPQSELFVCDWDIPYHFKLGAIQKAREQGYKKVIWCDSSVVVVKNPDELFKREIVAFHNLGHPLYRYMSDACMEAMEATEKEIKLASHIMACVMGFDFSINRVNEIFNKFIDYSLDGCSFQKNTSNRNRFRFHTFDQPVISLLLYRYGIELYPYGKLVYEPYDTNFGYGNDIYFINKGIK